MRSPCFLKEVLVQQEIDLSGTRFYIKDFALKSQISGMVYPHLKFTYEYDLDGSIMIFVSKWTHNYVEPENKQWIKIHTTDASHWFYIPDILKPYIGKNLSYRIESVFKNYDEFMRIKSVGFEFDCSIKSKKLDKRTEPYFTKSGLFSIPKIFLSKNFKDVDNILKRRVVFNKTTPSSLALGKIFMDFLPYRSFEPYNYFLKPFKSTMSINKPYRLMSDVSDADKCVCDFKYQSMSEQDGYFTLLFLEDECPKNQS